MKHANGAALDRLEDLLSAIRTLPDLKERTRGVFYRRSKSFLHFHDDTTGLFADVRRGGEFERFRVTSAAERAAFLEAVRAELIG
ncbi:hypothetical protein [Trinickia fusca]|uniref:Uncharacterized protein n=1 Tax=Trinickia fusca TaxID=2419777 RepID=A0A494X807_9BURK|nr:hypothetical protein [Trinickia fusca]RKP44139.1 hypothetical protein D7S89_23310 [Trinickia fusca]